MSELEALQKLKTLIAFFKDLNDALLVAEVYAKDSIKLAA